MSNPAFSLRRYIRKFSALALLAFMTARSHAGSPGGLHIIALPTAKAAAYTPAIKDFFRGYYSRNISGDCGENTLAVERAYYDGGKAGISGDFAIKAMTSKPVHRQLGKLMGAFRHAQYEHGFDAALVYDVQGQSLVFYGISQFTNVKKYTSPIALADVGDMVKLTQAICKAAARLPVQWDD
jgi:hypothetical protein